MVKPVDVGGVTTGAGGSTEGGGVVVELVVVSLLEDFSWLCDTGSVGWFSFTGEVLTIGSDEGPEKRSTFGDFATRSSIPFTNAG